jgi:hypothetical protein
MIRASWPRADQTMIAACERRELIADQPVSADPYQLFISCQVR